MIDDDVASLASGLSSNNTLHRNDLADMRFFCLERIQGHGRHIIVRVSLQEVLLRLRVGGRVESGTVQKMWVCVGTLGVMHDKKYEEQEASQSSTAASLERQRSVPFVVMKEYRC